MSAVSQTTRLATPLAFAAVALCAAGPVQSAPPRRHEVTFSNGEVQLSGTVVIPSRPAPVPAVVFVHGSGPMTREGFQPYAETFARLGVASLRYDKRGTGKSGGSWTTASLDDLAGDAQAAVRLLKKDPRIDPARIGFWGVSQAGWVAARAAAREGDTGFLVLISGGGVSPLEEERYSYEQEFRDAGLSETETTTGLAVVDQYFHYLASGDGRPQLMARLATLRANQKSKLHLLAEQLERILPSPDNRRSWSWVATYDPTPDIAKLHCPLLLMFGDRDHEEPTEAAVKGWRQGLQEAGNQELTLMVFPGAGHGIRMGRHRTSGHRPPFADGYMEAMVGWLWLHVVSVGEDPGSTPHPPR